MEMYNHKSDGGRMKIDDVGAALAFWHKGELCIWALGHSDTQCHIKNLETGRPNLVSRSTIVTLETEAVIHVGRHPAEEKLKKLINEKAKCVKMLTELRSDIENQLRPYSRKAEIISLLEEMEADDEQD